MIAGIPALVEYAVAAVAVAGAGYSAYESHEQGVAQANAAKQQARVAQDQATQQQINMRQRMLAALAAQNAQAGAGGIGTGRNTSFGANVNRQITQQQNDLMVTQANSAAQVSMLDQAAAGDIAAGNAGAASDIVGGLTTASMLTGNAAQMQKH